MRQLVTAPSRHLAAAAGAAFACLAAFGGRPLLAQKTADLPAIEAFTAGMEARPGLFTLYLDRKKARVFLRVHDLAGEFLYLDSLPHGLGSNDVGLDRGKLGRTRLCYLHRVGQRVLLGQRNLDHRAESESAAERQAVAQAFAPATLHAFPIVAESGTEVLLDAGGFLLRDVFGSAEVLRRSGQGDYQLDEKRSYPVLDQCRSFPRNTELTASLCFAGAGRGREVRSVAADPRSLDLRQRLSFVALPEPGYQRRRARADAGFFTTDFVDYAAPVGRAMQQRFIRRHRLEPIPGGGGKVKSPIVYHLDPGTPEPMRAALLDGARWWSRAFAAAGFVDAFRVEMLPEDADPMDARYHVIQWVHRSSRGWSYGNSVVDPRTGEIIKGHVSLGSRRVRQDYLIAQGLVGPDHDRCLAMAMARLRQLAAHEVGHTLGLAHNFAASTVNEASVMDYPHPRIVLDGAGIDLGAAYGVGVGAWDTLAIRWGYAVADAATRDGWLAAARQQGLAFLSDADARPAGSMHPAAHLWDIGSDPVAGLQSLIGVRRTALAQLGRDRLFAHQGPEMLDELLTPIYLLHRYQVEAVVKLIAGRSYDRSGALVRALPKATQTRALHALLQVLAPVNLALRPELVAAIPPRTHGARRSRELLPGRTAPAFDPLAAADAVAGFTLGLLLERHRAERLLQQGEGMALEDVLTAIAGSLTPVQGSDPGALELQCVVESRFVEELLGLTLHAETSSGLRGGLRAILGRLPFSTAARARVVEVFEHPERFVPRPVPAMPPGAPIGCGCGGHAGG